MRLQRLTLRNFQGTRAFTFEPNGHDAAVYGSNRSGKTTLASAFNWLLFNKDSLWRSDFEIKTLDENNKPIHGLEHEVEAVLDFGGEEPLTLRKVYKELWQKKRGSAESVFTGNTTDHYVNGVPVQKKEYDAYIAAIADEKVFKMLTSPTYFPEQLPWQERRRVLMEVAGIPADKSFDDRRKVLMSQKKEINDKLKDIPVRIDEAARLLPEQGEASKDALDKEIASLRKMRDEAAAEKVRIVEGGAVADKNRKLAEVKTAMLNLEREAQQRADAALQAERKSLNQLREKRDIHQSVLYQTSAEADTLKAAVAKIGAEIAALRVQWQELNGLQDVERAFDTACPTCGQALPFEQVEAAREKALADFNESKAKGLEKINAEGKAAKQRWQEQSAKLELVIAERDRAHVAHENLKKQVEAEESRLAKPTQHDGAVTTTEHIALAAERDKLEQEIAALQAGSQADLTFAEQRIRNVDTDIAAAEKMLAAIDQRARGLARVDELKAEERRLAAEFEKLEGELYQAEQELQEKVRVLEAKINSKFRTVNFKLFNVLINGGIEEVCEVLCNGVPYSKGLNNEARINAGLDIINTLAGHYGVEVPCFVDNAEAVVDLVRLKSQTFWLYVSGMDKKLRVEIENTNGGREE